MNEFKESLRTKGSQNVEDPGILGRINSKDPYEICDVLEETKGGIYLSRLEDAIINTRDIVQIYEFLFLAVDKGIEGFDQDRFEEMVRKSGNPKLMCYSMGFVPGTDVATMMESVIATNNTKYLAMLRDNEEYGEVYEKVCELYPNYDEIIEESKKYNFFPRSLEDFREYEGNVGELKARVIESENPHLITELANYIEYLNEYKGGEYDISDLTRAQEGLHDPMQAYEYLASVNVEDKTGLVDSVIQSGRTKFVHYVLEYVPGLDPENEEKLKAALEDKEKSNNGISIGDYDGEIPQ